MFSRASSDENEWDGIRIVTFASDNLTQIKNSIIEHADKGVYIQGASPSITESIFRNNKTKFDTGRPPRQVDIPDLKSPIWVIFVTDLERPRHCGPKSRRNFKFNLHGPHSSTFQKVSAY